MVLKQQGTDTHLGQEGFAPRCFSVPDLGEEQPLFLRLQGLVKRVSALQSYHAALYVTAHGLKPAAGFRCIPGIEPYSTFTAFLKVICKTNVNIKIRMETCTKLFLLTGGGGVCDT